MKQLRRVGLAVCCSVAIGAAIPGFALAQQASGAARGPGIGTPAQLPRTGGEGPSDTARDALLLGGVLMAAGIVLRVGGRPQLSRSKLK